MQSKQLFNQFHDIKTSSYKPKTLSTTKLKIKIISSNLPLNFFKPVKISSQNNSFEYSQPVQMVTPSFGSKDIQVKNSQTENKIHQKWFVKKNNALTHRAQTEPLQYKQFFSRQIYTKQQRRSNQTYRRQNSRSNLKRERKTLIPNKNSDNTEKIKKQLKYQEFQRRLNNKYSLEKIKSEKKQLNFLANFAFQNSNTQERQILKNFSKNIKSFRPKKLLPPINI